MDYESAGVSLQEQNLFHFKLYNKMNWLGGHVGSFDVGADFVVCSTDGIGSKIKLYDENKDKKGVSIKNLGKDLVSNVFNDIVTCGARPLFMNDYLMVPKMDDLYLELIDGINEGLKEIQVPVPLLGGETALQPDANPFDIAGFGIGACPKTKYIDGSAIKEGDMMLGLASNGFHCNGYTLIRKVFNEYTWDITKGDDGKQQLYEDLLRPTKSYVNTILDITDKFTGLIHGISHIAGFGRDNVLRLLGENLNLKPTWTNDWIKPPEFDRIQEMGRISDQEMRKVFNDGIGMVLIVDPNGINDIIAELEHLGESVFVCGKIEQRFIQVKNEETGRYN